MNNKNGIITTYWKRPSKIKSEITYLNGMLHGIAKFYTSGGWLHQQIEYSEEEIKNSTLFYPTGKTKLVESFENNERHGLSKCFNKKGELIVEDLFEKNRLIERKIFGIGIITF